jgi:enoyl-CoA hydratase
MSDNAILFERRGALALMTLNRPKALNALTHAMCVTMRTKLDEWAKDASVGAVAIRGEGDRAFCAGGDIRALYDSGRTGTAYAFEFYRDEYRLNATIKHFPKPYIALLRGIVMGGGVGVSVHGSHRVADESAVFAMPETGIGLFPDVGGSYFLPRCPGEIGMYLALTGARLKTADMIDAGVATHHVPAVKIPELLERLAAAEPPDSAISALAVMPAAAALAEHRPEIDRHFSEVSVEAVLASLDGVDKEWSRATAATIRTKSPTSLKLAYRQLRAGRTLGFDDCLRMEMRMVARVIAGHEFYEGVRATIIEKDNAPRWQPSILAEVRDADIDKYFLPLGEKELVL